MPKCVFWPTAWWWVPRPAGTDGAWEITGEPLADGAYTIALDVEDLAGNINSNQTKHAIDSGGRHRTATSHAGLAGDRRHRPVELGQRHQAARRRALYRGPWDASENATTPFDPLSVVIKDGNAVIESFTSTGGASVRTLTLAPGTHLLSVEVTDDAGNRSVQSSELVVTIDRADPADPAAPNLLASSDTGGDNADDITSIRELAFDGTVEANAQVRLLANGVVVGATTAGTDGAWEITSEPLADGAYTIALDVEDLAGNINSNQTNTLSIQVDGTAPQRPTLDLLAVDDTGLSNLDNVTKRLNAVPFTVTVDASENATTPFDPLSVVIKGRQRRDRIIHQYGRCFGADADPGTRDASVERRGDRRRGQPQCTEFRIGGHDRPRGTRRPGRPEPIGQQ